MFLSPDSMQVYSDIGTYWHILVPIGTKQFSTIDEAEISSV